MLMFRLSVIGVFVITCLLIVGLCGLGGKNDFMVGHCCGVIPILEFH